MLIRLIIFLLGPALAMAATPDSVPASQAPDKTAPAKEEPRVPVVEPAVREAAVEINGHKIAYRVTAGSLQLKQDDGKIKASIFHVAYERLGVNESFRRPVLFAFNGGPGSSAVWLHLGMLGPRTVKLNDAGTTVPPPPVMVSDNPLSVLDVCDLVFIDPVSTGYSRAENDSKPADFHSLNDDIESVGDFIRRWVGDHQRWAAPKFLIGESYGGIRAAGLARHLQSRYGMSLNGVVLLSSLLDFGTLRIAPGSDLSYLVYLPAFTGTAHFHGKITGDRDALIAQSTDFAYGDYSAALLQGSMLAPAARAAVAAKLATFTGIPAAVWSAHNLRIDPSLFRSELLRAEAKVLGRFDARVAWDATDATALAPDVDPSFELAYGAFATAMLDYLGRELGFHQDQPYEIVNGKVQWRWDAQNDVVNVSDRLAGAMRDNPHLRVLIMGGRTDLATPAEGIAYSIRHLPDLPASARKNITLCRYDGGHMFYLNPADLTKARADLVKFVEGP